MSEVVIEDKKTGKTRTIQSYAERRVEKVLERVKRARDRISVPMHKSDNLDITPTSVKMWEWYEKRPDNRTWKNQKHARKPWGRHMHRWQSSPKSINEEYYKENENDTMYDM